MANKANEFTGMGGLTNKKGIADRQPTTINPLYPTAYNFKLLRTPSLSYYCTKAILPGIAAGEWVQEGPFAGIKHPSGEVTFGDFSIEFICDEDMRNWLELYEWIRSTVNVEDFNKYVPVKDQKSDATLMITSNAMNSTFEVRIKDCFPTDLSSVEFDSTVTDMDPIVCTATFAYTSYEITSIKTGAQKDVTKYLSRE